MMCVISTTLLSICDVCNVYAGNTGNHPIIYIPRWNKQLDIIVIHNYSLIVLSPNFTIVYVLRLLHIILSRLIIVQYLNISTVNKSSY